MHKNIDMTTAEDAEGTIIIKVEGKVLEQVRLHIPCSGDSNCDEDLAEPGGVHCTISTDSSSSGILPFLKNSRSMTPITWQAAVDVEEQRPQLQDIFEAAINDRLWKSNQISVTTKIDFSQPSSGQK